MSTVSSITSVASSSASTSDTTANTKSTNEVKKEKQKYSAFNINSLYKGKSLENPKTSVAVPKHGLQTVGKVGAGRRVPPPANIPSLKKLNTTSNNNTTVVANAVANVNINSNVNIVPTGGQGWAASKDDESTNESISVVETPTQTASILSSKPTESDTVNRIVSDDSDIRTQRAAPDQKFAQEFPQLSTGNTYEQSGSKMGKDLLRQQPRPISPLISTSTASTKENFVTKKQFPNSYGLDGDQTSYSDDAYEQENHISTPPPTSSTSTAITKASLGNSSHLTSSSSSSITQSSTTNSNNYFLPESVQRQMQASYNINNNNSNTANQSSFNSRISSGNSSSNKFLNSSSRNVGQTSSGRPSVSGSSQRKPQPSTPPESKCFSSEMSSIITDNELKNLDQILEKQIESGWTLEEDIDYNAKIEFSDDDDEDRLNQSANATTATTSTTKNEETSDGKTISELSLRTDDKSDSHVVRSRESSSSSNKHDDPKTIDSNVKPYGPRQLGYSNNNNNNNRYYGRKSDSVFEFSRKDGDLIDSNKACNQGRKGEFYTSSRSQQLPRGGQSSGYSYQQQTAPPARLLNRNVDDVGPAMPRVRPLNDDDDELMPPPPSKPDNDARIMPPPRENPPYRINDYGPMPSRGQSGSNSYPLLKSSQQSYAQNLPPRLQRQVELCRQNAANGGGYSGDMPQRGRDMNGPLLLSRDYDREPRHRRTPPDYPDQRSNNNGRTKINSDSGSWRNNKPIVSSYETKPLPPPSNHDQRRDSIEQNEKQNVPSSDSSNQYSRKPSYDSCTEYHHQRKQSGDNSTQIATSETASAGSKTKDSLYSVDKTSTSSAPKSDMYQEKLNDRSGSQRGSGSNSQMRIYNDSRRSGRYDRKNSSSSRGGLNTQPQLYQGSGFTGPVELLHRNRDGYRSTGPVPPPPYSSSNQNVRKSHSNDRIASRDVTYDEQNKKQTDSMPTVTPSPPIEEHVPRPRVESNVSSTSTTSSTDTAATNSATPTAAASPSPSGGSSLPIVSPMYPTAPGSNTNIIRAPVRNAYGPPSTGKSAFGEVTILGKSEVAHSETKTPPPSSTNQAVETNKNTKFTNSPTSRQSVNNNRTGNSGRYRNNSTGSNTSGGSKKLAKNSYPPQVSSPSTAVDTVATAATTTNNNVESDLNNEEWETASENSDLISMDRTNANRDSVKKSTSGLSINNNNNNDNKKPSTDLSSNYKRNETLYSNKIDSNSTTTYSRNRHRPNIEHYQASGNRHSASGGGSTIVHNHRTGSRSTGSNRRSDMYRGGGTNKNYDSRHGGSGGGGSYVDHRSSGRSHHQSNMIVNQMSKMSLDDPKSVEHALADAKLRNMKCSNNSNISTTGGGSGASSGNHRSSIVDEDVFSDEANANYHSSANSAFNKKRNRSTLSSSNKSKRKERSKSKNRNRTSSNSSNQAIAHSAGSAPTGNRPASNVQLTSQAKTKDVGKNEVEKSENSKLSDSGKQRTVSSGGDTIVEAKITPTATKSGLLVLQNAKPASQIGLLKSSSFEQHDSGIESGDQPPSSSTSTSQRSSPNNDTDNKGVPTVVASTGMQKLITTSSSTSSIKCTPSVVATTIVTNVTSSDTTKTTSQTKNLAKNSEMDSSTNNSNRKYVRTLIYENTKLKEENKVLSKIDNSSASTPATTTVTVSKSLTVVSTVSTASTTTTPVSHHHHHTSHHHDELNMKMASVKKVWENSPVTPTSNTTSVSNANYILSGSLQNQCEKNCPKSTLSLSQNKSVAAAGNYSTNMQTTKPISLAAVSATSPPVLDSLRSLNSYNNSGNGSFHQNMVHTAATSPPTLNQHLYAANQMNPNIASNAAFQYGQVDSLASFAAVANQNTLHPVIPHYLAQGAQNQQNANQYSGQHSVTALINPQPFTNGANPAANLLMAQFAQSQPLSGAGDPHYNKYSFAAANSQNILSQNIIKAQYVNANHQNASAQMTAMQPQTQQNVANWPVTSSLVAQHNTPVAGANQQNFMPQPLAAAAAINFVQNPLAGSGGNATSQQVAAATANQFSRHHPQQTSSQQQNMSNMNRQVMDGNGGANLNAAAASQNIRNYFQANMINQMAELQQHQHHHQNAQVAPFLNQDPSGGNQNRNSHQSMHHHHNTNNHHRQFANATGTVTQAPQPPSSNWSNHSFQAAVAQQQQLFFNQCQKMPNGRQFLQLFAPPIANPLALAQLGSRTSPLNPSANVSQTNYPNPIQRPNSNQKGGNSNRNNSSNKSYGNKSKNYNTYSRNNSTPSPGTGVNSVQPSTTINDNNRTTIGNNGNNSPPTSSTTPSTNTAVNKSDQ